MASDPTVSRTIDTLARDADRVLAAIDAARAAARARAWRLAGRDAPDYGADAERPLIVDIDATLVEAHSDKQGAAPTFKRGYGFHPLWAFVDHGSEGTGEPLAVLLRPGNAGSNTAADHVTVARAALRQLPGHQRGRRPGRRVLIRADGAGATHDFLDWVAAQRLSYSVGFTLPDGFGDKLRLIPDHVWAPALDADGEVRDGAFVAEVTGLLNLTSWPTGMRVIVRKERPHPGAQLRITDIDGNRITAFATNTTRGQLPALELRHRQRARAEDRIRCAKDTGLLNLPLHDLDQNRIWCAIVALACEVTAWAQMLALSGHQARRWEPKRLRLRLFSIHRPARALRAANRAAPTPPRPLGRAPPAGDGPAPPHPSQSTRLTPAALSLRASPPLGPVEADAHPSAPSVEPSHPHGRIHPRTGHTSPGQPFSAEARKIEARRRRQSGPNLVQSIRPFGSNRLVDFRHGSV